MFGVNFPETKLVSKSLLRFYGIGPQVCTRLMAKFHIHQTAKIGSLNDKQLNDLAEELSTMTLENDLKRQLVDNIRRLRDMGTYRGRRHAMSLPVRGQRTRTQVSCSNTGYVGESRLRFRPDHDCTKTQSGRSEMVVRIHLRRYQAF